MKNLLLLICAFVFSLKAYSQPKNDNDIGSMAILIQTRAGSGSGFYIQDTTKQFICFVTASMLL